MVVYYGKRIESARVGARMVAVECDRCGCEYFYELARIGTGGATAHYGVGTSAATRSSREQSQRDLQSRLASEAELVPCPKCNWISDDLVQGYRQGRFRRVGMLAAGVGLFGTIASLIGAWFISTGPAADRGALSYFLFGGPVFFVSLAVAMILLRNWRRSRIQPNRNFPLPPRLPPGSPPALVVDEASGELQAAEPRVERLSEGSDWHDFQLGRHEFPPVCCNCLKSATTEHAYKRFVTTTLELEVPRCPDCARQSRRDSRRIWWTGLAISLLLGSGVLLALPLGSFEFWLLFGTYSLISVALASYVASAMTAPVKVRGGDRARGIVRLRFRNPEYRPSLMRRMTTETDAV